MRVQSNSKGFTLVEALVYVAILSVVSVASVSFLFDLDALYYQYRAQQVLLHSSTATLERIVTDLRQAEAIDFVNSEFATSTAGVLTIQNGATTTVFRLDGGDLTASVNGGVPARLNVDVVTVDGFTVYRYEQTAGELVRVKLDLSTDVGGYTDLRTFYTAAVIRGSYE